MLVSLGIPYSLIIHLNVGIPYKFFCFKCMQHPSETGMLDAGSLKLLLILAAVTAFTLVQPVEASQTVQAGPSTIEHVPDGGSTISLLGFALLGVAALRRKLGC